MVQAIRQQSPGISFNKILINAFPGMSKRERENLIPVVSECLPLLRQCFRDNFAVMDVFRLRLRRLGSGIATLVGIINYH
jgi:hypothetical protein